MLTLRWLPVLHPFAALFRSPAWLKAQILLAGAILAPGQRTVAAAASLTTPATMRCSTGRCGRPAKRLASCSCCCSNTWIKFRWASANHGIKSNASCGGSSRNLVTAACALGLVRDPQMHPQFQGSADADNGLCCAGLEVTPYQVRGEGSPAPIASGRIEYTTPILMGIFSWTTLAAHLLRQQRPSAHRTNLVRRRWTFVVFGWVSE